MSYGLSILTSDGYQQIIDTRQNYCLDSQGTLAASPTTTYIADPTSSTSLIAARAASDSHFVLAGRPFNTANFNFTLYNTSFTTVNGNVNYAKLVKRGDLPTITDNYGIVVKDSSGITCFDSQYKFMRLDGYFYLPAQAYNVTSTLNLAASTTMRYVVANTAYARAFRFNGNNQVITNVRSLAGAAATYLFIVSFR